MPKNVRRHRLLAHSRGRAQTRYELSRHEAEEVRLRIKKFFDQGAIAPTEDVVVLERQSQSRSRVAVRVKSQWIPVIYDKKYQVLATFLPLEALTGFIPPRLPTAEEQKEAWLAGKKIPVGHVLKK